MRLLPLVLALGIVAPGKARARPRSDGAPTPSREPPWKQGRRSMMRLRAPTSFKALRSPCGRHVVEIDAGTVIVDGRRVHPGSGTVELLAPPLWRPDGGALAWLERNAGETRLVVLPELSAGVEPLAWVLPSRLARDPLHWAGEQRVVVGPELLSPRAVASWD